MEWVEVSRESWGLSMEWKTFLGWDVVVTWVQEQRDDSVAGLMIPVKRGSYD